MKYTFSPPFASAHSARHSVILGLGRSPGGGNGNPLPGESHGHRSLVGYSPRGHKESNMTEEAWHTHTLCRKLPRRNGYIGNSKPGVGRLLG